MATASQWLALWRALSEQEQQEDNIRLLTHSARVTFAVTSSVVWQTSLDDFLSQMELSEEEIVGQYGRWVLTQQGLYPDSTYEIGLDRLDEVDWLAHIWSKTWFYDPTDFLDAYEAARMLANPEETEDERHAAIQQQITVCYERNSIQLVLGTSQQLNKHVYLPTRMRDERQEAFARFLDNRALRLI